MIVETNKNASTGKYEVDIKTNGVVAELEANKEVSIDVSNYIEPVEITPSSGKDGMEKTTITLENISSGSSNNVYYSEGTYTNGEKAIILFSKLANEYVIGEPITTSLITLDSGIITEPIEITGTVQGASKKFVSESLTEAIDIPSAGSTSLVIN